MSSHVQCIFYVKVEGKNNHWLYCTKDIGHEGSHEVWLMPLSMKISLGIKELLWYRWIKQPKLEKVE